MEKVRRKTVTMADVAQAAQVSVTTVSHVLNRTATISADTIARVQAVIEQLGYQPKAASELRGGRRTIGLFAPDLANELYAACAQAMFEEAWNHDYAVLVCDTRHREKAKSRYIKSLIAGGVCGLIFLGGTDDEAYILEAARQVPVVLGDRTIFSQPLDAVVTDNRDVMRRMVGRLAGAGYRRLGFVGQDLDLSNVRDRFEGFRLGLEENALELNPEWVHISPALRLDTARSANALIQRALSAGKTVPQVFLCSSDLIAVGVMAALQERGYAVPREVGVVGFDGVCITAHTQPPLTTIAQDITLMGKSCVTALLNRMLQPEGFTPVQTVVNAKIVQRGSVRL